MHLSSTDLPVPEPPITTSDCPPGMTRGRRPASTCLAPKALAQVRGCAILGAGLAHRLKNSSVTM